MSTRSSRSFTHRSRERIKAAKLEKRLIQFVNGEVEMSRAQVTAASNLLNKILPNLRAVEVQTTEAENKNHREMTNEELLISLYRTPDGKKEIYELLSKIRAGIMSKVSAQ